MCFLIHSCSVSFYILLRHVILDPLSNLPRHYSTYVQQLCNKISKVHLTLDARYSGITKLDSLICPTNIAYLHYTCIILASYLHHTCIILASYFHHTFIIFFNHTCIILASYLHHTCTILASYLHHTCTILASYLHHTCIILPSYLHHTCIILAKCIPAFYKYQQTILQQDLCLSLFSFSSTVIYIIVDISIDC